MILESARSFVWKDEKPNTFNCRVQSLKLSQEITESVDRVIAIDTQNALRPAPGIYSRNKALRNITQRIVETSQFDLFHRSPLIAERQTSGLLVTTLRSGLALLDEEGTFGTVLYFYKVCQFATGNGNPVPILDNFCDIFRESVFLGEFPTKNFENLDARFRNMRRKVSKDPGRKKGKAHEELDSNHTWMVEGRQSRISHSDVSSWFFLRERAWDLDGQVWARLSEIDKEKKLSSSAILQGERFMWTEPLDKLFIHLEGALLKDFDEGFKFPGINFFKVYELAVRTLQIICKEIKHRSSHSGDMLSPVEAALLDVDEAMYSKKEQIEHSTLIAFAMFRYIDEQADLRDPIRKEVFSQILKTIGPVWRGVDMEGLHWKSS